MMMRETAEWQHVRRYWWGKNTTLMHFERNWAFFFYYNLYSFLKIHNFPKNLFCVLIIFTTARSFNFHILLFLHLTESYWVQIVLPTYSWFYGHLLEHVETPRSYILETSSPSPTSHLLWLVPQPGLGFPVYFPFPC